MGAVIDAINRIPTRFCTECCWCEITLPDRSRASERHYSCRLMEIKCAEARAEGGECGPLAEGWNQWQRPSVVKAYLEMRRRRDELHASLNLKTRRDRAVYIARRLQGGANYDEIGEELMLSRAAVRGFFHRYQSRPAPQAAKLGRITDPDRNADRLRGVWITYGVPADPRLDNQYPVRTA